MDEGFIFGSCVNIWDANKNERVKIGIEMCKDSLVVPIYGLCGRDNCNLKSISKICVIV
jgi:hypothetical protein